jgi:uncharacterized protein YqgC (DUF456 family)
MYSHNRPSLAALARPLVGIALLGVGLIGLVLPLIPGIPLLIVGALLLRPRTGTAWVTPAIGRATLSGIERVHVRLLLFARKLTNAAESMRLARRERARQRDR